VRKPFRVLVILAIVVGIAGACWHEFGPGRRLQGRTENEWIASLATPPGEKEMQQWRALGAEAVPILARALERGTSPLGKWYQSAWYKFPVALKKRVARPVDPIFIHRNASLVLAGLNCDISAAAPALGRALHDDDESVRVNAAICLKELLPRLGPNKSSIVPDLVQAMQDTNHVVRENVTICLGNCPEQSRIVAPSLARGFDDSVQMNRYLAVQSLKRMNLEQVDKGDLGPMLIHSLQNNDFIVCLNAANILGDMKWDPALEVPAFTEMLGDYRSARQRIAAVALGKYGPQASSAIPALQRAFETGEPRVRTAASDALVEINPRPAARVLAGTNEPVSAAKP
jgi:HEAT repeat protein